MIPKDLVGGAIMSAVAGGIGSELGGGKFTNGAVTGAFGYLFNSAMHDYKSGKEGAYFPDDVDPAADRQNIASIEEAREDMIGLAYAHEGNTGWNSLSILNGGPFSFKCNIFVADMAQLAGIEVPRPYESMRSVVYGRFPLLAEDWANPAKSIKGWAMVRASYKPGDVIAFRMSGNASGHMGFVGRGEAISASDRSGVRTSTLSYYLSRGAVVRRWVGF